MVTNRYSMIQKRKTCLYCGENMESITAKKKFCCNTHKVYFHREKKVEIGNPIKLLAIKIPVKQNNTNKAEMPVGLNKGDTLKWLRNNS